MEEENVYANWLNERYPFDSEARNKEVESVVLSHLNKKQTVRLVDVGAGTGSTALYLLDKIKGNQNWYFIEQDASFEKVLMRRLKEYAGFHKYTWERANGKAQIITPSKQLSFQFIKGSLLDLERLLSIKEVDLILANAVFDLFTQQQIQSFLAPILDRAIACYFTLNYRSMSFHPEDPFDSKFISLYEQHMERPQAMGRATGKQVGPALEKIMNNSGRVISGISTWHIQREDIKMHYYLLNFMENAIQELPLTEDIRALLPKWIQRKKDLIITRQLELKIDHLDIFHLSSSPPL